MTDDLSFRRKSLLGIFVVCAVLLSWDFWLSDGFSSQVHSSFWGVTVEIEAAMGLISIASLCVEFGKFLVQVDRIDARLATYRERKVFRYTLRRLLEQFFRLGFSVELIRHVADHPDRVTRDILAFFKSEMSQEFFSDESRQKSKRLIVGYFMVMQAWWAYSISEFSELTEKEKRDRLKALNLESSKANKAEKKRESKDLKHRSLVRRAEKFGCAEQVDSMIRHGLEEDATEFVSRAEGIWNHPSARHGEEELVALFRKGKWAEASTLLKDLHDRVRMNRIAERFAEVMAYKGDTDVLAGTRELITELNRCKHGTRRSKLLLREIEVRLGLADIALETKSESAKVSPPTVLRRKEESTSDSTRSTQHVMDELPANFHWQDRSGAIQYSPRFLAELATFDQRSRRLVVKSISLLSEAGPTHRSFNTKRLEDGSQFPHSPPYSFVSNATRHFRFSWSDDGVLMVHYVARRTSTTYKQTK